MYLINKLICKLFGHDFHLIPNSVISCPGEIVMYKECSRCPEVMYKVATMNKKRIDGVRLLPSYSETLWKRLFSDEDLELKGW